VVVALVVTRRKAHRRHRPLGQGESGSRTIPALAASRHAVSREPMPPYTCNMTGLQETRGRYRVSARGQFSLPASARRRRGIEGGGDVEVFDLGEAVVIFPGGPGT